MLPVCIRKRIEIHTPEEKDAKPCTHKRIRMSKLFPLLNEKISTSKDLYHKV